MDLADIDPGVVCSGPMSNVSYDSHVVTRRRMADELPRVQQNQQPDSYNAQMMDVEIQRVSRELYKAFGGMNSGFAEVEWSVQYIAKLLKFKTNDFEKVNSCPIIILGQGSDSN